MASAAEHKYFGPEFHTYMAAYADGYHRIINAAAEDLYTVGFHVEMRDMLTSNGFNQRDARTYLVRGVELAFERAGKRISATTANRVVTRFLPANVPKKIRKTMQVTPFPQTADDADKFLAAL